MKVISVLIAMLLALFLAGCGLVITPLDAYYKDVLEDVVPKVEIRVDDENEVLLTIEDVEYVKTTRMHWYPQNDRVAVAGYADYYGTAIVYDTSSPICYTSENITQTLPSAAMDAAYFRSDVDTSIFTKLTDASSFEYTEYENDTDAFATQEGITRHIVIDEPDSLEKIIELTGGEPQIIHRVDDDALSFVRVGLMVFFSNHVLYDGMRSSYFDVYVEQSNPGKYYMSWERNGDEYHYLDITQFIAD